VKLVAEACEVDTALGKKGVRGVLKSVASRQAFLSESSHRIRFVYLPKHSSWLNQIEVIFGVIMRKVVPKRLCGARNQGTSTPSSATRFSTPLAPMMDVFTAPARIKPPTMTTKM